MNKLNQLEDFSMYDGHIPCALCKGEASQTIMGKHWKCSACAHLFNQDGSKIELPVPCLCDACSKGREETAGVKELEDAKGFKKLMKKVEKAMKKVSTKATQKASMKFILTDENSGKEYSFTVIGFDEDYFFDYIGSEDDFCNLASTLESKYGGVLDAGGNGFSSYELKPAQFPKVLKEFKDWFKKKGYTIK